MSLILDALRKLDREKSSRGSGVANIALEILRPDLPRRAKRRLLTLAAIFLTAIATAAITYSVMVEFGRLPKLSSHAPVNPPTPSQQVVPAPPGSGSPSKSSPPSQAKPPASSPRISSAPLSREQARGAPDEARQVTTKIKDSDENKKPAEVKTPAQFTPPAETEAPSESKIPPSSIGEKESPPHIISKEADVAPGITKRPAEQLPSGSAMTPPSLRISGIVWSDDPLKRLAVINGLTLTEGSVIEGVKVMKIFPRRVRFLQNDRPFEIPLGSSAVIK
jgi:general secretion pathway protein B